MNWTRIAAALVLASTLTACLTPTRDYKGYVADDVAPADIVPDQDTRSSVLAQLGSPSTTSIFDDKTWVYMSTTRERFAFYHPRVTERTVTAIRFGDDDKVDEVLLYNAEDGEVIRYDARETRTSGRELGLLEQLFGNAGRIALPSTGSRTPGNPTGR